MQTEWARLQESRRYGLVAVATYPTREEAQSNKLEGETIGEIATDPYWEPRYNPNDYDIELNAPPY